MELSHLQYFSVVAEEENITRAAKRLFISQPALSATIARLEKELGFDLFRRDSNKISLTDAGRCFWEYTNSAFASIHEGITKAQQIANRNKQCVRVASSLGIVRTFCEDYRAEHPDEELEARICNTEEIASMLANGSADLGINLGPIIDSQFSNQTVMNTPWCIAVNEEHPLRFRQSVSLTELESYQLFCSNLGHTFEKIQAIFSHAQCSCKLLCLDERDVLFKAVYLGLGATVCLPMAAEMSRPTVYNVTFIPITGRIENGIVSLVTRRDLYYTPQIDSVTSFLRRCFQANEVKNREIIQRNFHSEG